LATIATTFRVGFFKKMINPAKISVIYWVERVESPKLHINKLINHFYAEYWSKFAAYIQQAKRNFNKRYMDLDLQETL
jgi:hypothetical protein